MKLLVVYKNEDREPEVFDNVREILRTGDWLVVTKHDDNEWGLNRDEVHAYWLASDAKFDAEAAKGAEAQA